MTVHGINFFPPLHLFLFLIIFSNILVITFSIESNAIKCLEKEKSALLKFKAELIDGYGRLSTWGTEDCCKWKGVRCDNRTNHVVSLDLRGPRSENFFESSEPLRGKISPSLLKLVDLSYVDLSNNDFNTIQVPEFIGSFTRLQHLNLSNSNFNGSISIPHRLGNFSTMRVLDLSGNRQIYAKDLDWLVGFHSLQYLDLSEVDLRKVKTWLGVINKLKSLERLYMQICGIQETLLTSPLINASSNSLSILDLSSNELKNVTTLIWFCNFSSSLSYVDVSFNYLEGKIPDSLMNLMSLSYLDLSDNNLVGRIPNSLGNLMLLNYLDLSGNKLEGSFLDSLGNLMSLSHLDLSGNNIEGGFPESHGNLSNLVSLDMSDNKLDGDLTYMSIFLSQSTMLEYLDLTRNRLYGSIPPVSKFSKLKILSLGGNQLNGSFIESELRLPYLLTLDVSENRLTGRIPDLSSCSSLDALSLNDNMFNGTLPETIGYLSRLNYLDLHSNNLVGVVPESHFFNLSKLGILDLSYNSDLTLRINSNWIPPFQLGTLKLSNCNLGPNFPKWLQKQRRIANLDISGSKISDTVPEWFWNNSRMMDYLNMSYNQIRGFLPNLSHYSFTTLDLSSNEFNGLIPLMSSVPTYLDLSRNRLSGQIVNFCNATYAKTFLDLSDNRLSGEISKGCLMNLVILDYLNLGSNNFSGEIPNLTGWYCTLSSLHLRNNSFTGQIPLSLGDCKGLRVIDLGENYFTGKIPTWIGESLLQVGVLSLRSNKLDGILPTNLCNLANIQVLDISMNKVFGTIPRCLNNFSIMSTKPNPYEYQTFAFHSKAFARSFYNSAYIMWKGQITKYVNTLGMVKVIDLSSNNLVGEIPTEITSLVGLMGLNLSRNNLVGSIPYGIGELEFLNFLDLSENNLSGGIPATISQLNHLGVMNLSFNNLSGRIPWSNHLETFSSSAYMGNRQLCGLPLSKLCPGDQMPRILKPTTNADGMGNFENEDEYITTGFYVSLAIGFVIAFWGIFGSLTFIKSCRIMFSKALMGVEDWLYVQIGMNKNRFHQYFQNRRGPAV